MYSAGQVGPVAPWFENPNAPERASPETIGRAFFENESFESWSSLYGVNTFSIFFVTTAFLGLLAKGSEDVPGYTSCVVNITSVSGHVKLSQNHVRLGARASPTRASTPPPSSSAPASRACFAIDLGC